MVNYRKKVATTGWKVADTAATDVDVWSEWNRAVWCVSDGTNSATTTSSTSVWSAWNREYQQWYEPTSTTATNTLTWSHWAAEAYAQYSKELRAVARAVETPEMRQARAIEAERRAAEARAAAAIVEAAKEKAEKLLQSALAPEQKEELKTKGFFHCRSKRGNLYRIKRGTHGNVKLLDPTGKKEIESLCIQPDNVPAQDAMLAQKLMIENDEDSFRRIANISRILN